MKILKKCVLGASTLGIALSLEACNDQKSSQSGKQKGYTLSDILNSKEKHQIIVTNKDSGEDDDHENDHVVWAGFIGNGQIEGIYLDGIIYDYGYKDMKNQSDKDFKQNLTDMGEDYDVGDHKSTFATAKAETKLYSDLDDYSANPDNDDLADIVSLNAKFKNNGQFKFDSGLTDSVSEPTYNRVQQESNKKWITYTASEGTPDKENYQMHIKVGKTNLKPQIENVEETVKKYNNAKETER